jgi:hypothetical protein
MAKRQLDSLLRDWAARQEPTAERLEVLRQRIAGKLHTAGAIPTKGVATAATGTVKKKART